MLSGGTALGAIQVGMLRALHERGIAPDLLVGTSVGALNAAFVAGGYSAQRLAALGEIWRSLRSSDVFGNPRLGGYARTLLGRGALASPVSLRALLERHLPASHAELAMPVTSVATDLLTGAPILLAEGTLRENLLASAAIPGVFPPVDTGGRMLVDGGVAAHVPVAPARELGARTLFVLDTGYPCTLRALPRGLLPNLLHVLSLVLRHQSLSALTLAGTDCTVVYLPSPCPLDVPTTTSHRPRGSSRSATPTRRGSSSASTRAARACTATRSSTPRKRRDASRPREIPLAR